jgi:hypothetical protein
VISIDRSFRDSTHGIMAGMSIRGYRLIPLAAVVVGVGLPVPAAAMAGTLKAEPSPLEFTSAPVGFTQAKAVTLTAETTNAMIEGIKLEDEEPIGQFAIQPPQESDCKEGKEIQAGISCEIVIFFQPSAAGEKKATLIVESNATNNPVEVPLVGFAIAPELAIAPFSFDFGPVQPGSKSPPEHFSIENRGSDVGTIEAVALSGGNAGQFEITANECTEGLGIGAGCGFAVLFAPTSAGSKSATVKVTSNAPESPQMIAVSGTGTSPPPPAGGPQASAPAKPSNAFAIGKAILNRRRGTASLPVRVPGPGSLLLGGKGLIARKGPGSALVLGGAGTARLAIVAAGRKEASLGRTGRARVVAKVTYIPAGGDALTKSKKIGLVKRR